ncbi:conserved Plasmodium protein, unknown function [Plasmodium reichenowi]|uniref:Transmembrane protein n=14 Tax=Plasmodium (Laverania) TaxID=418107 RepID=C6S3K7_PLAF7|nr:conserved Plasmodium protein, unknown function [Plasmodium falciparum 3D7]XP_019970209.1 hypothetical protein PRSY57_1219100 [Plasmodium reichenowi]XP_028539368.1 conserved Plasmodium protein, unknown function [Plasmodium sp. gorilla clade G2]XP_028541107.1 conserved Plasmodium protein, unknown function [Plasmodium sp. gorilla clade G2]ETW17573.1 hypothetical protein PFFVO_03456 [Plasmodium falciparum Vietnam Oak-Knoll (FVO)]ETW26847.1 hypothetical protein PFFCH_05747 [Plasmodium falciparum|eukprot:XP_002585483.1 conserved Plasmodium protein, unknown function [Plasmodium falciparum 3D7]
MDDDLEALVEKPSIDDSDECLNVRIYLIQVLFIFLVCFVIFVFFFILFFLGVF